MTNRGTDRPGSIAVTSFSSSSYLAPPNSPKRALGMLWRCIDSRTRCGCDSGMGESVSEAGAS